MGLSLSKFLRGRETRNGLAGYLSAHFTKWGTATVASGATTVTVSDTSIATGDIIVASVYTKGTNACYIVGTSITNATSFTFTVSADPGSGGVVIGYFVIRP